MYSETYVLKNENIIPANLFMSSSLRRKHFIFLLLIGLWHHWLQCLFILNIFFCSVLKEEICLC